MNTKYVPAIIMLLGGLVRCIIGIYDKDEFSLSYALSLLLVLVIFYIIGLVIKAILDKHIPIVEEEETQEEVLEEEKELEDISETDEREESEEQQEF